MLRLAQRLGALVLCAAFGLLFIAGCAENEKRKVTVIEEQHEGEVVEESPGEMVVE